MLGYNGNIYLGSIRSVQSVPMLSPTAHTWDGEPCPVHHQPMVPLAALYGEYLY